MTEAPSLDQTNSRRRDLLEKLAITYACAAAVPLVFVGLMAWLNSVGWSLLGAAVFGCAWFCFVVATYFRHPVRHYFDIVRYSGWTFIVVSQLVIMTLPFWLAAGAAGATKP